MSNVIRVGIADMKICEAPDKITTIGLGSCIGIVIYDRSKKIAGLVHIMLPDSSQIKNNLNKMKFADLGIELLIDELISRGCKKESLKAKIAGGAKMFNFTGTSDLVSIGDKNIAAVKHVLAKNNIQIVAEDVGENYGRTIILDVETCVLQIITAGGNSKEI